MKVAAYTGTRNLYESMIPAAKSLVMHSDVDKIYFFIEDDKFPYELPDIIECVNAKNQRYFSSNGPNMTSRFTYMAMIRSAYAYIFPELDRILSLDVDTFAVDDVSDIWNVDFNKDGKNYMFAACKETDRSKGRVIYSNIGVALYNLDELRKGTAYNVIDILNKRHFWFVEQDAFNMYCGFGKIFDLDSGYNVTKFTDPTDHPRIIHFAGNKHWQDEELFKEYTDISWEQVMYERLKKGEIEEVKLKIDI